MILCCSLRRAMISDYPSSSVNRSLYSELQVDTQKNIQENAFFSRQTDTGTVSGLLRREAAVSFSMKVSKKLRKRRLNMNSTLSELRQRTTMSPRVMIRVVMHSIVLPIRQLLSKKLQVVLGSVSPNQSYMSRPPGLFRISYSRCQGRTRMICSWEAVRVRPIYSQRLCSRPLNTELYSRRVNRRVVSRWNRGLVVKKERLKDLTMYLQSLAQKISTSMLIRAFIINLLRGLMTTMTVF